MFINMMLRIQASQSATKEDVMEATRLIKADLLEVRSEIKSETNALKTSVDLLTKIMLGIGLPLTVAVIGGVVKLFIG